MSLHEKLANELVRDIARVAQELDASCPLTADGSGFVQLTASRRWGITGWNPDMARPCGGYPEGDGWLVTIRDRNGKMRDARHMYLSDRHLTRDRQGHVDSCGPAVIRYTRMAAELSGWVPPGVPPGDPDADPVGLQEVATRLGVSRDTADKWRSRGVLPDPDWMVGGRPAWRWDTIHGWARDTGRLPAAAG